jgi:hypothetical protein
MARSEAPRAPIIAAAEPPPGVGSDEANASSTSLRDLSGEHPVIFQKKGSGNLLRSSKKDTRPLFEDAAAIGLDAPAARLIRGPVGEHGVELFAGLEAADAVRHGRATPRPLMVAATSASSNVILHPETGERHRKRHRRGEMPPRG